MEKVLLQIKKKHFIQLQKILKILKKKDLPVFNKTLSLINSLRVNNIILKEFKI